MYRRSQQIVSCGAKFASRASGWEEGDEQNRILFRFAADELHH